MRKTLPAFALIGAASMLTSCLAKKARAVDEAALMRENRPPQPRLSFFGGRSSTPAPQSPSNVPVPAAPTAPKSNPLPSGQLRMPDMLDLPEDKELRTGTPAKGSSGGAVISRPPSE